MLIDTAELRQHCLIFWQTWPCVGGTVTCRALEHDSHVLMFKTRAGDWESLPLSSSQTAWNCSQVETSMALFRDMDPMCSVPLAWNVCARKLRRQKTALFLFKQSRTRSPFFFFFFGIPHKVTSLLHWWKQVNLHRLKSFFAFTEMRVILNAKWTGSPWKCGFFLWPIYPFLKQFLISCQVSGYFTSVNG